MVADIFIVGDLAHFAHQNGKPPVKPLGSQCRSAGGTGNAHETLYSYFLFFEDVVQSGCKAAVVLSHSSCMVPGEF